MFAVHSFINSTMTFFSSSSINFFFFFHSFVSSEIRRILQLYRQKKTRKKLQRGHQSRSCVCVCCFFIGILCLWFSYCSSFFFLLTFKSISFFSLFCPVILQSRKTKHTSSVSNFVSTQTDRTKTMNNITYEHTYIKRIEWRIEEREMEKKRTRRAYSRGSSFTFV